MPREGGGESGMNNYILARSCQVYYITCIPWTTLEAFRGTSPTYIPASPQVADPALASCYPRHAGERRRASLSFSCSANAAWRWRA